MIIEDGDTFSYNGEAMWEPVWSTDNTGFWKSFAYKYR
jgi:hypothetical protein